MAARTLKRSLAAPAEGWLQSLPALGVDGTIALIALVIADDPLLSRIFSTEPSITLILGYWGVLALFLSFRLWQQCQDRWLRWSFRHLWPMVLILAVALASPLWSVNPEKSAQCAIWLLSSTFLGFFIGYRFYGREFMAFLLCFHILLLMTSLLIALLLPDVGIDDARGGSWHGIVLFKNSLGYLAALAVGFLVIGAVYGRLPLGFSLLFLALAIFMLIKTKSASGIIIAAAAVCLIVTLWLGKRFRISALVAILLIIAAPFVIGAVVANLDQATAAVGRDPSFTGRTAIWADALEVIEERPWFGFGLEAIWGAEAETPFPYLSTTGWAVHAHNGFLDLANELGLPIALLAFLYMLRLLFVSLDTYITTRSSAALFFLVALNSFLLYNMIEAGLFEYRRIEWLLCVAVIVAMKRRATERLPEDSNPIRARSQVVH